MCAVACPFGVPKLDEENKIMDKCDLCADRRAEGLLPACVSACPTEALKYGEIDEILWEREGKVVANLKSAARRGRVSRPSSSDHYFLQENQRLKTKGG